MLSFISPQIYFQWRLIEKSECLFGLGAHESTYLGLVRMILETLWHGGVTCLDKGVPDLGCKTQLGSNIEDQQI